MRASCGQAVCRLDTLLAALHLTVAMAKGWQKLRPAFAALHSHNLPRCACVGMASSQVAGRISHACL